MIIRRAANGSLILIRQTDHSRFVGMLAAHWGNGNFAKPQPYDSVVRAAAYHDFGWLNYETAPMYDAATGGMPTFTSPPPGPAHYAHYQWCNDWMTEIDSYAGLLINMHRTGLWRNRHDMLTYPQSYNIKQMSPEAETFVSKNEALQRVIGASFSEQELWVNYWLMQVWDLIGLYFCCREPVDDYIDSIPDSYDSAKGHGIRLNMNPINSRKVAFEPYPFDLRPLQVQLLCSHLPTSSFSDAAAFRQAYFQAPIEITEFELI